MKSNKNSREKIEKEIKSSTDEARKKVRKTLDDYKSFATRGNIVDMAIGVVLGSAFTNIVNSLVNTTITPFISMLTNNVDLSTLFIALSGKHYDTLEIAKEAGVATWNYGLLLNSLFNFIIISFTMFLVVKYINRLKRKTIKVEQEEKVATTKKCIYCLSQIPIEATKCAYCTSTLQQNPSKISAKKSVEEK
ncbi:MAG: large conductance mechanosensitive channel protein MscL [Clostridia bacterium]